MTDELKQLLNILQNHIVSELQSDNVLLIFDNKAELLKYKRKNKYICPNQLLVTINDLVYSHCLDGIRFRRYHFVLRERRQIMTDKDKYIYDELECSYNDDFVKCPYCGFEDYDVYDGLDIDAKEYGCPNCGKNFGVVIEQKIEFTSFPINEKEGK